MEGKGEGFVALKVADDIGGVEHLDESIKAHAGLCYADPSDQQLWVRPQLGVEED